MKTVTIIPISKALTLLSHLSDNKTNCYYLSEDYQLFTSLNNKLGVRCQLNNLAGLFNETLQELIIPYQDLIALINQANDSVYWWGHQLASKSSSATPLFRNAVYLHCCKKLLTGSASNLVFVVDDLALISCIAKIASDSGWEVHTKISPLAVFWEKLYCKCKDFIQVIRFILRIIQKKYLAYKFLPPVLHENNQNEKRAVFRSWVTQENFDNETGAFRDRNFGCLPDFMRAKGYKVWTIPMFFNLRMPLSKVFRLLGDSKAEILIPEKHLPISDAFAVLCHSYKISRERFSQCHLNGLDISPLINEVLQQRGIDGSLCELNLCYLFLEILREKGAGVDIFLYPFENNAPEKLFVLGCRKYFPKTKLIGFQHSAYYPNNMAFHLGSNEKEFHPLPDKIVCSGPIYQQLLENGGFPREKLVAGQNLRFEDASKPYKLHDYSDSKQKKKILLTLSFHYDQAFELFVKIKEALRDCQNFEIYIRNHPLLSNEKIANFLDTIDFGSYQFAEGGTIQDWLVQMYAFIPAGASITSVEAAVMGVPVVRLVLDNSVTYDALVWPNYPIVPSNTPLEIRKQLERIDYLLKKDPGTFVKLGKKISKAFFTKPTEENLQVYL